MQFGGRALALKMTLDLRLSRAKEKGFKVSLILFTLFALPTAKMGAQKQININRPPTR